MTGMQLQKYLQDLDMFKIEPVYMTEVIDVYACGKFPSLYQVYLGSGNNLSIGVNYHTTGEKYVDFTFAGKNLYASHKLSEMNLETLCNELNKTLGSYPKFTKWMTIELRNNKINSLYE